MLCQEYEDRTALLAALENLPETHCKADISSILTTFGIADFEELEDILLESSDDLSSGYLEAILDEIDGYLGSVAPAGVSNTTRVSVARSFAPDHFDALSFLGGKFV